MKEALHSFILLFFLSVPLLSQEPAYWQLSETDGLPSLTIYQIEQDDAGYMWFATASGLCRFDGKLIQQYSSPTVSDNEIIIFEKDKWGRIWATNLSGQLILADGDSLAEVRLPAPHDKLKTINFFIDGAYLWILDATLFSPISFTLFCFELRIGEHPKLVHTFKEDHPIRFFNAVSEAAGKHYFWFLKGGAIHLLEISGSELSSKIVVPEAENFPIGFNHRILPIKENIILIHDNQTLSLYDIKTAKIVESDQVSARIQKLRVHSQNEIILSTTEGVKIINNAYHGLAEHLQFFKSIAVNNLFIDRENNLWLGTSGNGVLIVPDLSVEVYNTVNSGLVEDEIFSIEAGPKTLIGHNKGVLSIFEDGQLSSTYHLNKDARIVSIANSADGLTWLGCDDGLTTLPSYQIVEQQGMRVTGAIKKVIAADDQVLWVATSSRVCKVRYELDALGKVIKFKDVINVLPQRSYALHKDLDSNLWIGSVAGLYKYTESQLDTFKEGSVFKTYRVSDIAQTTDSTIWVATYGDGLLQIKGDSIIHKWDENTGFPTSICTALHSEGNDLWVGTNQGMTRIKDGVFTNHWIDTYDGLPSNEVRALSMNKEEVWVGTAKGLAKFPLSVLQKNDEPPAIALTAVHINNRDTVLNDQYRLNHRQNNLSFSYLGFAYRARGNVTYQYRLLGLMDQWTTTQERTVTFFTLAPGEYRFEAEAVNEDGVNSVEQVSVAFTILKPWWRQLWFQVGGVLALLLLSSGIVYWRQSELRQQEKTAQEFRDRIHNLRMEALQTQMNPHFIFNALNAIQDFLITNDREQAIHYLSSFARMIRQIFDYSRRKSISLEEEVEFLNLYLELEKLRFGSRVEVYFDIDTTLQKNITEYFLPPLLIQPIVENAFKHGLMHKTENGVLKIFFETEDGWLKCTVEDDGVGRQKAEGFNRWRGKNRKASGLSATRDRLEIFHQNKEKQVDNFLLITDLFDQGGNPTGTKVEIYI